MPWIEDVSVLEGKPNPRGLWARDGMAALHQEELRAVWAQVQLTRSLVRSNLSRRKAEMLHRIVAAKALPSHRLWVRFENGVEGEVDVSDLVGKGIFKAWQEPEFFNQVFIDEESGTVTWPGNLDLAPDAPYRDVAGVPVR